MPRGSAVRTRSFIEYGADHGGNCPLKVGQRNNSVQVVVRVPVYMTLYKILADSTGSRYRIQT